MKRPRHKYLLLFLDWIIVVSAYILSLNFHATRNLDFLSPGFMFVSPEILFFVAYSGVILLIFVMNQMYRLNVFLSVTRQLQGIAQSLFYSAIGIALLSFFTKSSIITDSRLVMLYFLSSSFVMLAVMRVGVFRSAFKVVTALEISPRRLIILGATPSGIELGGMLAGPNEYGLQLLGFLDDDKPVGSPVFKDVQVLGRIRDVRPIVSRFRVQELLFCLEGVSDEKFLEILDLASETRALLLVGSPQFGVIPRRLNVETYGDMPVFAVLNGTPDLWEPMLKRVMDPVVAILLLAVFSPLFLVTALAIKLDSRGPILFKQIRVGKNGRLFVFFKFRSMVTGSDQDDARPEQLRSFIQRGDTGGAGSTKIVKENCVTRVGRVMRKTSIDELPQLLNVVKGDMSLVGPRPCLPYEWESYSGWHKRRLMVTPGCTGLWQVLGRSEVGFRDMVILDLFYSYNISFHLDVWLILKTIPVMIFGTGGK